jgi:DNA-binding SARP family transcriptional activator
MAFEICLLGGFELLHDGARVSLPPSAQRLVALLAIRGRPLARVHVAGVLWTDVPEDRSCANLRSTLWRLGRTGRAVVAVSRASLALGHDVRVDMHAAALAARRLIGGEPPRGEDAELAHRLSADLLPDWYDEWLVIERERLRQLRLHALEALAVSLAERGRYGEATDAALAALCSDPLRESAHRTLIRVYIREGNLSQARAHYQSVCELLRRHLGVEPSAQLDALLVYGNADWRRSNESPTSTSPSPTSVASSSAAASNGWSSATTSSRASVERTSS